MRFAYIDSQRKEVAIPGVDALRLRIELGAIGDETMFYDSSADRWARASEHEIFRTLKRELAGHDAAGYVAPASLEADEMHEGEIVSLESLAPDTVDEEPCSPEELAPDAPASSGGSEWDLGIDLTLDDDLEATEGGELAEAAPVGFETTSIPEAETTSAESDPNPEFGGREEQHDHFGLDLEPSLAEYSEGELPSWTSQAPEQPRHRDPDAPPAWTQHDSVPGDPSPFAPASGNGGADPHHDYPDRDTVRRKLEARRAVEARGGRTRPSRSSAGAGPQRRPVRKRQRRGGALVAVIALVAVGAGAWFGVQLLADEGSGQVAEPVVELPEVPVRLEPRVRALAVRATQEMVDALRTLPESGALASEPNPDWLGGRYLATASDYGGIPRYWRGVLAWVDAMREAEEPLFAASYREQVEAEGLAEVDRALVVDRGVAGFQAAARDRSLVYGQLEQVATAALSLHGFLESNEANIDYEPASGGLSRDPILEAVPVNDELGDEMWSRVGDITDALDALGLLDRVTTERLSQVFFEKLAATPIR